MPKAIGETLPEIQYEEANPAIRLLEKALREANEQVNDKQKALERSKAALEMLEMRLDQLIARRNEYAKAIAELGGPTNVK
jgi:DNA repair ATPase RecN